MELSEPTPCPRRVGELSVIMIAVIAIFLQLSSELGEAFQWRRGGPLLSGLTSHFTHWSWDHLAWDIAAFAALAFAALRIIPQRLMPCLLVAGIAIPFEVAINQPQFETYRGLSGIDSALFGLIAAGLWKLRGRARGIAALALVGFVGKTTYEHLTGATVFVDHAESGFVPVVSAHITGVVSGLVVGAWSGRGRARDRNSRRHQSGAAMVALRRAS